MPRSRSRHPGNATSHHEKVIRWLILLIVLGMIAVGAMMYSGIIKMPGNRGGHLFSTPVPLPSSQ